MMNNHGTSESCCIRFWDKALWFLVIGAIPFQFFCEDIESLPLPDNLVLVYSYIMGFWEILALAFVVYALWHLMRNRHLENKIFWVAGFFCFIAIMPIVYYGVYIKKNMCIVPEFPYLKSIQKDKQAADELEKQQDMIEDMNQNAE